MFCRCTVFLRGVSISGILGIGTGTWLFKRSALVPFSFLPLGGGTSKQDTSTSSRNVAETKRKAKPCGTGMVKAKFVGLTSLTRRSIGARSSSSCALLPSMCGNALSSCSCAARRTLVSRYARSSRDCSSIFLWASSMALCFFFSASFSLFSFWSLLFLLLPLLLFSLIRRMGSWRFRKARFGVDGS